MTIISIGWNCFKIILGNFQSILCQKKCSFKFNNLWIGHLICFFDVYTLLWKCLRHVRFFTIFMFNIFSFAMSLGNISLYFQTFILTFIVITQWISLFSRFWLTFAQDCILALYSQNIVLYHKKTTTTTKNYFYLLVTSLQPIIRNDMHITTLRET